MEDGEIGSKVEIGFEVDDERATLIDLKVTSSQLYNSRYCKSSVFLSLFQSD